MTRPLLSSAEESAGSPSLTGLGERDWQVRVHERAAELRTFGAGMWMWENGLRSLQVLGAEEQTVRAPLGGSRGGGVSRRLLYLPCTHDLYYVAFGCALDDLVARRIPVEDDT